MSELLLNLARKPFRNDRPVVRITLLTWGLGAVLFAVNLGLFWGYYQRTADVRDRVATLEREITEEHAALARAEAGLLTRDLETQNRRARFLNRRIAARTFSWSRLFDHLTEVLPADVRLSRLSPDVLALDDSRRLTVEDRGGPAEVLLQLEGQARSGEDVLAFVDALFASSLFRNPVLARESEQDDGLVSFNLSVFYLPETASAAPEAPAAPADEAGGEES